MFDIEKEVFSYGTEYIKLVEMLLQKAPLQAFIVLNAEAVKFLNGGKMTNVNNAAEKLYVYGKQAFGEEVVISRLTKTEFTMFVTNAKSRESVIEAVDSIIEYAKQGIKTEQSVARLGVSAGIVFISKDDEKSDLSIILRNAQIAMQNAIEDDFSSYMVFNSEMAQRIERTIEVVDELRENICNSKFILKFQPLFDVSEGKLIGFEVLSRICSDKHGIISPTEFVGLAEKNNLICDLDKVIFDLACRDIRRVMDMGIKDIKFSINVTPTYILKPGFIDDIKRTMAKYGVDTEYIALEITENTVFGSLDIIRDVVSELNRLGIAVYLDDFGSGFSNFIILQELKFARIKLDKTLIDTIETDRNNMLVKKVIEIIDELGIKSVAEGIERKEQLEELIKLKCDIGQGYYFGKPMSFNCMIEYINKCQEKGSLMHCEN